MAWVSITHEAVLLFYVVATLLLGATGMYYGIIAAERVLRSRKEDEHEFSDFDDLPEVTIQIPVYNERHVVDRLLRAVGNLDWSATKLEVQVIDDSTDRTSEVVSEELDRLREKGIEVEHIRRDNRAGYKAGAIQTGLETATGEFVALFDADFVPSEDFLRRTVPYFQDPSVGCVQTRWEHLNESHSPFTRAQALALDAHFAVEQWVRSEAGSLMSFNATSCVWRRETLLDVGGWSSETVAEDLDLTAAALLNGWRFVYTEGYSVPCEIPATISGFVRQQTRWARGSTQNVRKHLSDILSSKSLSRWAKFHSVLHVCHYLFYPLLLVWIVLHVLLTAYGQAPRWILVLGFIMTTPGPLAFLAVGQVLTNRQGRLRRLLATLPLTLVGIGISLRMTRSVLVGFIDMGGSFERTPKFGNEGPRRAWHDRNYDRPLSTIMPEILAGGWCAFGVVLSVATGAFRMALSVAFFSLAFGFVALLSILHT